MAKIPIHTRRLRNENQTLSPFLAIHLVYLVLSLRTKHSTASLHLTHQKRQPNVVYKLRENRRVVGKLKTIH